MKFQIHEKWNILRISSLRVAWQGKGTKTKCLTEGKISRYIMSYSSLTWTTFKPNLRWHHRSYCQTQFSMSIPISPCNYILYRWNQKLCNRWNKNIVTVHNTQCIWNHHSTITVPAVPLLHQRYVSWKQSCLKSMHLSSILDEK